MKVKIIAHLQHMANSEIMGMINQNVFQRIKNIDESPEIRVYVVGHEGTAKPNMVGAGQKIFQYFREAIQKLGDKLKDGVMAFHNHGIGSNSHEGRDPVGELIGKSVKEIGGKLSALAAVYIYPKHRSKNLDIASIEADVAYSVDKDGIAYVDDFETITGIALGDSRINKPAFPGATLLASMQAFQTERGKFNHNNGGGRMTREELKAAIKEGNFSPSDFFNEGDLSSDSSVKRLTSKAEQTGYEHHKQKVERQLGKPIDDYVKESDEKIKGLTKEKDELNSKFFITTKTNPIFRTIVGEKKLSKQKETFVEKALTRFTATAKTDEELKVELVKFVDSQIKEFEETAKIFGVKIEDQKDDQNQNQNQNQNDNQNRNLPPGDDDKKKDSANDYQPDDAMMDPKKNDFIPA